MTTDKNAHRLADLNAQQRAALFLQLKERQRKEGQQKAAIPLRNRTERVFPLSFAQQRLWFLDQLEPGSSLYTIPQILRLSGPLQVGTLVRAIEVLVARHETLRTTFTAIDGVPRQVVEEQGTAAFALIDLRACEMTIREKLALQLAREDVQRPFDLSTGPLLRVTVLRLSEQEHILLLLIHHIISDAWSDGILLQELFTLVESLAQGKAVQLPPLSLHYVDFALWQREQLQGAMLERLLAYWRTQLAHIPMLQLPFDHPRPAEQTFHGEVESLLLPVELVAPVRALAQQEGATLFMILLTAFKVLLYRYTNQEDITVGSLIANRTSAELEGLIGFFVNTLVLHTSVDGSLTFRELLGRVREVCLGAYAHQDLPFERLVEELQPERSLSYSPLFQVLFTLQNVPEATGTLVGLEISPIDLGPSIAKFDLSLYVAEHPENISVTAEYNTDLFVATTIRRLLTHFQTILAACVASPGCCVACLPLLSPEERRSILTAWNATVREYPAERCLHQLFEQQAAATPDAIAVVFEDHELTYQELDVRADQLAHYLQHVLHVGKEVPVGIYIDRSVEMLTGLLGILKAGGAYVPLDPDYPQARLAMILEDANPGVVLTQTHLRERMPGTSIIPVCLDTDWPTISHTSSTILSTEARPSKPDTATTRLAYIIYTSGSTGRPKGVQVTHRALVNFLTSMSRQPGLTQDDTLLAVTSLSFDIAGLELYLPLLSGAQMVIASRDLARDGEQLMQALALYGATTMQATPSTWRMLLEAGWQNLSHLRILCGGEALPADLGQQLLQKGAMLWNLYGPTETTIWSAIYRVEDMDESGSAPLGYPVANTQIYVLDAQLEPVPVGVPGELYIGGHGLSRGYFKQTALTAEKFLPDPFSSVPGMRLYRTGDLASYRADGVLKFLGRIDQQVKVHGFRIELQEIEGILNQHPGVFESVVSTHVETDGDKRLIAYVVPDVHHVEDYVEVDNPQERVAHWLTVWDTIYTADTPLRNPTFNLSGWKSSYTQEPIPSEEMREWVDTTVERLSVHKLDRVLEIGCGTGLLLFQLAPLSGEYWATDFSPGVLAQVQQQVQKLNLAGARLLHREASDFTGIPEGFYDLVILNSVVQYFPDIDYLLRVLEGAVKATKPGGIIFLGDLRSLLLLQAFHASIQLRQAPDNLPGTDLLQLVRIRAAQEEELLIDPDLFTALQQRLPQISQLEVQLRRGHYHNELSRFRYDVLLHIWTQQEPHPTSEATLAVAPTIYEGGTHPSLGEARLASVLELDWQREKLTLISLRQHVQKTAPQALYISGVPNARLLASMKACELLADEAGSLHVGDLRETLHTLLEQGPGIDPEEFWHLSAEYPYTVSVTWSRMYGAGYFDVILRRVGSTISAPPLTVEQGERKPWSAYANTPLHRPVPQRLAPMLRQHLKQHLPEYMLPATFVFLPALPLTPNGKIDRRALPVPDYAHPRLKEAYAAPRSHTETILAEICAQTLDIEQVGIHDNFFELGGNSLLVIRLVARANKAGVPITAKQVFLHQTVARLAEVVGTAPILADQKLAIGPTSPTPGQCPVLAESVAHPEYFNLAYFVFAQERFAARSIRQLVRELIAYHDALRICRAPAGSPLPLLIKELPDELPCIHVDLSRLSEAEVLTIARQQLNALQTSMHLDRGPLFQVVLFDCSPEQSSILLLIGHYLVADIEAWQILLEDVVTGYQQLTDTGHIQLPARSTSFKQWAGRLHTFARSAVLEKELPYWLAEARWHVRPLPLDYLQGRNAIGSSRTIETELTSEETTALLSRTLKRYDTQMDALLITAIALACLPWSRQESLLVNLFSHGREGLFEDMDVSRTVGTFGTDFPVLITLASTLSLEEALYQVKAQLAQIPNHGVGYGILRHLSQSAQAMRLRAMPEAEIVVNYIGATFNDPRQPRFQIFGPYTGPHHDQETDRGHKLQITGQVFEGKLQLRWDYSENLHRHTTIESLAQQTIEFIRSILVLQPGSLVEDERRFIS